MALSDSCSKFINFGFHVCLQVEQGPSRYDNQLPTLASRKSDPQTKRLLRMFESSPALISAVAADDGEILYQNERAAAYFGQILRANSTETIAPQSPHNSKAASSVIQALFMIEGAEAMQVCSSRTRPCKYATSGWAGLMGGGYYATCTAMPYC